MTQAATRAPQSVTVTPPANDHEELDSCFTVKLVGGTTEDGSLEFCDTDQVPPDITKTLLSIIRDAKNKQGDDWIGLLRSSVKCIYTSVHVRNTYWPKGEERKLGCKECFSKHQPCILLHKQGYTFVVLPVVPQGRASNVTPGDVEYYVSSDDKTLYKRGMEDEVWSSEKARAKNPTKLNSEAGPEEGRKGKRR